MRGNDLEKVNWPSLKTAYGVATEVPIWLKQLTSSDPKTRNAAFEQLTDQIYHQGSVYEATPHVVPFLVELLRDRSTRDKNNILDLLWLVALGQPVVTERHEWLRPVLEREGRDFDREVVLSRSYVEATIAAVRKGLAIYLDLLDDEDPRIRIETARLLSELSVEAPRIVPGLRLHAQADSDGNAKATLIWALGKLLANSGNSPPEERSRALALFDRLITSAESPLVRFAAAAAQLEVAGNEVAPEAIELLVDAATRPETYPGLPWLDEVAWTACDALAALHGDKRASAFEALLANAANPESTHDIVVGFLNRVFRGKDARRLDLGIGYNRAPDGTQVWNYTANYEVKQVRELAREQKSILSAIARSEKFWEIRNNLLEAYGLPGSREALRQFLNATGLPNSPA